MLMPGSVWNVKSFFGNSLDAERIRISVRAADETGGQQILFSVSGQGGTAEVNDMQLTKGRTGVNAR